MANEERRGGIGFGNQKQGGHVEQDDEPVEATRALDIDDIAPPTEFIRQGAPPAPPPPAGRAPPPRPGAAPARPAARPAPAPPPPPPAAEEEEDQSTRMLDAMDYDPMESMQPVKQQVQLTPKELRVVSGPDRGKIHRIVDGTYLVGRGLDCQIVLADPAVSRKHFKIERNGEEVVLSDLGGANGTNINGGRKARHVLENGDQVEIGTSVMEFYVEGAAPKRAKETRGGGSPSAKEERGAAQVKQKSGAGKMIAIVAVGAIVVAGGGGAAWYFLKAKSGVVASDGAKGSDKGAEAPAGGEADVSKQLGKAKTLLAESPPDLSTALDVLKEAKKIDPTNKEVRDLIKKTRADIDVQDAIDEAKSLAKSKDYDGAMKKLGEVDKESLLYADAQSTLQEIKENFVNDKMAEAKKALDSNDNATATKVIDAILAVDPTRAEAKVMKAQLAGGGAGGGEAAKGADPKAVAPKGAEPAKAADVKGADPKVAKAEPVKAADAKAEPKAAVKGAESAKAAEPAAGGKKADFTAGLAAYHSRSWSAAIQAFDGIANGAAAKDQKAKAASYAAAVKVVEDGLNEANAAAANPTKAASAYNKAYSADKRVDGFHGTFLAGKAADAYISSAKASLAGKNYSAAVEAAREAQNYADKPEAAQIEEKCMAAAAGLLKQAKTNMEKKEFPAARDAARQVVRILPSSDPRSQEAKDIIKQASDGMRSDSE